MLQRRFELLAVAGVSGRFEVVEDSLAREFQAFSLALKANLLLSESRAMLSLPRCGGLDLGLDRLAFPPARHVFILTPDRRFG